MIGLRGVPSNLRHFDRRFYLGGGSELTTRYLASGMTKGEVQLRRSADESMPGTTVYDMRTGDNGICLFPNDIIENRTVIRDGRQLLLMDELCIPNYVLRKRSVFPDSVIDLATWASKKEIAWGLENKNKNGPVCAWADFQFYTPITDEGMPINMMTLLIGQLPKDPAHFGKFIFTHSSRLDTVSQILLASASVSTADDGYMPSPPASEFIQLAE
ncbi:MAG: hypothetical protein AABZ57_07535 [Candidatus Margulisiibacteriota bacterium]